MPIERSFRSLKRPQNSAIPTARKRVRHDNDVPTATRSAPRERLRHQQTLTQIDFVKSNSFKRAEEGDLTELEPLPNANVNMATRRTPARTQAEGPRRRSLKRDTTLTQLDFVKSNSLEKPDYSDLTELAPRGDADVPSRLQPQAQISTRRRRTKKRDSTLTQIDFFSSRDEDDTKLEDAMIGHDVGEGDARPPVPALDGADDTPARPARKTQGQSSSGRKNENASIGGKIGAKGVESQECQPRKRRKVHDASTPDTANRRRSGRLAAVAVPKENTPRPPAEGNVADQSVVNKKRASAKRPVLEIADPMELSGPSQGQLQHSATQSARGTGTIPAKRPVLEIQETVFFEPSPKRPRHTTRYLPVTPSKPRDRIPSSQTPESITLSTQKSKRRPLDEMSTNIQVSPSKSVKPSSMKPPAKQSPKQKICVLKVPSKGLLPRPARIEDSQHDIYSLQPTSSLTRKASTFDAESVNNSSTSVHSSAMTPVPAARNTDADVVVEPSPTKESTMDTQKSLPDVGELLGFSSPQSKTTVSVPSDPPNPPQKYPAETPTDPLSGGHEERTPAIANNGGLRFDNEPVNMIPELDEVSIDELSDLGSPIPNETQFDKKLFERISSSSTSSQEEAVTRENEISPTKSVASRVSVPATSLRKTPLPTPRLVQTSPARRVEGLGTSRPTTSASVAAASGIRFTQHRSFSNVKITRVPLNDTVSSDKQQSSSSSPFLPPPQLPPSSTQKSIYPASMPHPSQVSTQAPSQGYLLTSSALQSFLVSRDAEIERITIKDSSSVPARLSQYRQHNDDNNGLADVSDREDDLDLDPASFRSPPSRLSKHAKADTEATTVIADESTTQTPTQELQTRTSVLKCKSTTQSSPVILNATTKSQRDATLEVIALTSSSSPPRLVKPIDRGQPGEDTAAMTTRPQKRKRATSQNYSASAKKGKTALTSTSTSTSTMHFTPQTPAQALHTVQPTITRAPTPANRLLSSPTSSSIASTPSPRPLKRRYSPIPGFDNETQSDFTQGGHVTAAYVHRMREDGLLPPGFVPKPYKAKNWKVSSKKTKKMA